MSQQWLYPIFQMYGYRCTKLDEVDPKRWTDLGCE
jgi:hypothetical protein